MAKSRAKPIKQSKSQVVRSTPSSAQPYPEEFREFLKQLMDTLKQQGEVKQTRNISKVLKFFIEVILVTLISSALSLQANNLQREELKLSEKNQPPVFRIESEYQDGRMTGYNLISSGGIIEHLVIQIERLIYLDTRGPIAWGDFYIPYSRITEYFMLPSSSEIINLYQQNEFNNPLDISNLTTELGEKLKKKGQGYLIRSLDILTLSYSDYRRTRHTEKYILSTNPTKKGKEADTSNALYLFPLNENALQYIETKVPECFEHFYSNSDISNFLLPNELYSHVASDNYFSFRHVDANRDRHLVDAAIEYISTMGFESSY